MIGYNSCTDKLQKIMTCCSGGGIIEYKNILLQTFSVVIKKSEMVLVEFIFLVLNLPFKRR